MLVLDTEAVSLLRFPENPRAHRLIARITASGRPSAATITTFQESMRGWLALYAKANTPRQYIQASRKLHDALDYFAAVRVLDFDERAAIHFERLKAAKVRVGTMDLRIASVALAHSATLLSANLTDFRKVPGLDVQDWSAPGPPV